MEGELGSGEVREFLQEVPLHRPESAAAWLQEYLPTVKVIYAFQLLSGTDVDDGWTPLHKVYSTVWNRAGGILQADGEGFSDEDGFTVLWQFADRAKGAWNVGVLGDGGRWVHFEIDLGNQEHREAFWRGEVPIGAKLHLGPLSNSVACGNFLGAVYHNMLDWGPARLQPQAKLLHGGED